MLNTRGVPQHKMEGNNALRGLMDTNSEYLENGKMTVQPVPVSGFEHEIRTISRFVYKTNSGY
jgi:hypothetical protein